MKCPKCEAAETVVYDSRETKKGRIRRRQCAQCGYRWQTAEIDVKVYARLEKLKDAIRWAAETENGT